MPPRSWFDNRLVEHQPKLDVYALHLAHALLPGRKSTWSCGRLTIEIEAREDAIIIDGEQRVAVEREECCGRGAFT